jgi:hypothetical protein
MIKMIGIAGRARSGKDTTCSLMMDKTDRMFYKYSFAQPIKQACNLIFNWDERHAEGHLKEVVDPYWKITPRFAYQTMGTEWGREFINQDIWLMRAQSIADASSGIMIIPDVRFINEAEMIKKNGLLIGVRRDQRDDINGIEGHPSEKDIDFIIDNMTSYVLDNNGTVEQLKDKVEKILQLEKI